MKRLNVPERIMCAAVMKYEQVYTMPAPHSHEDILEMMDNKLGLEKTGKLGYLATNGEFLDTKLAGDFVLAVGQCASLSSPPDLLPVDLWPKDDGKR